MARISIEEQLTSDARFIKLLQKIGDYETALGALVRLWSVAQTYWKKDKSLIPESAWKKQCLNPLLVECGFAEKHDSGYYAKGSKKHFDWLVKRIEAGKSGGKNSARSRRSKSDDLGDSKLKQTEAKSTKRNPSTSTSTSTSLSSSATASISASTLKEEKKERKGAHDKSAPPPEQRSLIPEIMEPKASFNAVACYCEAWKGLYKVNPLIDDKASGQIKALLKSHGPEKFKRLVESYIQMRDQWFIKKRHDVSTLVSNINTVWHFAETGKVITNTQLNQLDKDLTHANLLKTIREGKLND
jgi:hypothetical protein